MSQISIKSSIPLIFIVLFSVLIAAISSFGQPKTESDTVQLPTGQAVEGELKGEQARSYNIPLTRGQFLYVIVDQKGIDVVVTLFGSGGKKLIEIDNLNGSQGPEPLTFIAENDDSYRLEIRSPDKNAAGRYEAKIKELRAATEKDKNRIAAQQVRSEGILLYLQGNTKSLQNAVTKFEETLRLYRSVEDRQGEATILNYLGVVYITLNEYKKAADYFSQASSVYKANGDKSEEAQMLQYTGFAYSKGDENRKAIDYYNQALLVYRAIGNKLKEPALLTDIGLLYAKLDENKKALEYYGQALALFQSLGNKYEEGRTFINIGVAHTNLGEFKKAVDYFLQGLQLFKTVGERRAEVASALLNIGSLYADLGDSQKALDYYQELLPLLGEGVEEKRIKAQTLSDMGTVYHDLKDHKKALEYFGQALTIFKDIKDREREATTLSNIGRAYFSLEENRKAIENLSQALILHKAVEDKSGEGVTLSNLGLVYSKTKENQKALESFNHALVLHRTIGNKQDEARTLYRLTNFLESTGDFRLAIVHGKQSVNKYQELRQELKAFDVETQRTYLKTVEGVYRKLAGLLISEGRIAEAEQVLAMLKEEEVFDYLRREDKVAKELLQTLSLNDQEREALKRYEEIADDITYIGKQFGELEIKRRNYNGEDFPQQAQYDELKEKLKNANIAFQKFLEELKIKFRQKGDRIAQVDSSLKQKLFELGEKRTAVVSTIVGEDRLNIIVTTAGAQRAHTKEISEKEINSLVAEFRQALTNPAIDPRPTGQKLYDLLVKPIEGDLKGIRAETILWSLDGTLRYIPTAALWDKQNGYLAEKYANVILTLASRDNLSHRPSDTQLWNALGVGVSQEKVIDLPDGNKTIFSALKAVPEELDCIITDPQAKTSSSNPKCQKGIFTGRKFLDDNFTLKAFENALGRYTVVHIASHFSFVPGNDKDSFLLLGGGEQKRFTVENLSSIPLTDVELIVLSACNTATPGENANGTEIEGFGAVAQKQGAKAVIATLWAVADTSTKDLMVHFYQLYDEKKEAATKAEALRKAQMKIMQGGYTKNEITNKRASDLLNFDSKGNGLPPFKKDENSPFAHPYYWSPFVLIGNWR